MKTSVYFLDASLDPGEEKLLQAAERLSDRRREKAARLRFRKDRILSLSAGLLLDQGLRNYGLTEKNEEIEYRYNGKPYLKNHPDIYFNLSHSGTMIMAAFSHREIGCDIERIKEARMGVVRRYFTEKEQLFMKKNWTEEEKNRLFTRYWTLKESVLKVTGEGMRMPLNSFELQLGECGLKNNVTLQWKKKPEREFSSFSFQEYGFAEYQAAICVEGGEDLLSDVFFSFQNLQDVVR